MLEEVSARLKGREPGYLDKSVFLSAVLVPLVKINNEPHVLFEVRAKTLRRQPGEISFPGGKLEGYEYNDPMAAALREASEELGIDSGMINIFGPLDRLMTPLGALAYPFVGEIRDFARIKPSKDEIHEIFTVPLEFFINNPPRLSYVEVAARYSPDFPFERVAPKYKPGWQARTKFPMYIYEYQQRFIWGMTARIIYNFITVCWPENEIYSSLQGEILT